jgi:hypothetical protein
MTESHFELCPICDVYYHREHRHICDYNTAVCAAQKRGREARLLSTLPKASELDANTLPNREAVKELIERLQCWLETGRLVND